MSHFAVDLPNVIFKPGKMVINVSVSRMKLLLLTFVLVILYVYFIILVKTWFMKLKKLDELLDMAVDTKKHMIKLQNLDRKLGEQLEDFNDINIGYF